MVAASGSASPSIPTSAALKPAVIRASASGEMPRTSALNPGPAPPPSYMSRIPSSWFRISATAFPPAPPGIASGSGAPPSAPSAAPSRISVMLRVKNTE